MAEDPWKKSYEKKLNSASMSRDLSKADYERYFREGYNSSLTGSRNRPHSSAPEEVMARYDGAEYRANLKSRGSDHTRNLPPAIWEGDNTIARRTARLPDSWYAPVYPAMAMPVAAPVPVAVAAAAAAPAPAAGLVRQPNPEDVQMAELLQDFYREGGDRPQTRVFIPQGQLALRRQGAAPLPTIPVDGLDFLNAAVPAVEGLDNLLDAVMEEEQADAEEAAAAMMDLFQYSIPNPQGLKRGGVARDVGFNMGKHNGFRR
jgi:hypothetical protein